MSEGSGIPGLKVSPQLNMETLKLGPRLNAVASFIPAGSTVADVGTDHGYLPIWLRLNGISSFVIASDIRPGPLESARKNAEQYGVSGISLRLCPGLRDIRPEEVDTVVLSGMSGETIRSILEEANWNWKDKRLILEANTKHPELLSWLYQNGMHIAGERIPEEHNRAYRVYSAVWGSAPIPRPAHLWGGFSDSRYARRQARLLLNALAGLAKAEDELSAQRAAHYRAVLEDMKDAYHWRSAGTFGEAGSPGDQAGL